MTIAPARPPDTHNGGMDDTERGPEQGQPAEPQPEPQQHTTPDDGATTESTEATQPSGTKQGKAKRFLASFTDLSFTNLAYPKIARPQVAKVVYLATIVLSILWWIGGSLKMIIVGAVGMATSRGWSGHGGHMANYGHSPMALVCGIMFLLFGWIAVAVIVFVARLVLEFLRRVPADDGG